DESRVSQMPAFGKDALLPPEDIAAVVDYVLTLSGAEQTAYSAKGETIFAQNCASCHGPEGRGDRTFGAPNLTDAIWLYGSDRENVYQTVFYARAGMMPAWQKRLDPETIRQLAIYVHQLGGGEKEVARAPKSQPMPEAESVPAVVTAPSEPRETSALQTTEE
ncbi:MAG: c-type cytochrome, partial [Alphaproteobacteria bacterium]|nr:c-type cytochrome [Alphaproteobacteria bacterium]